MKTEVLVSLIALIVAITTLSLTAPIIIDKLPFIKSKFVVSPFLFNNSLYANVYNNGLKGGEIRSVGYCYFDNIKKECQEGGLTNFYDIRYIGSKESKDFILGNNFESNEEIFQKSSQVGLEFVVIVCDTRLDCQIYFFDHRVGCYEEKSLIFDGKITSNFPRIESARKEKTTPFRQDEKVQLTDVCYTFNR